MLKKLKDQNSFVHLIRSFATKKSVSSVMSKTFFSKNEQAKIFFSVILRKFNKRNYETSVNKKYPFSSSKMASENKETKNRDTNVNTVINKENKTPLLQNKENTQLSGDIIINENEEFLLFYTRIPLSNVLSFHSQHMSILLGLVAFIKTNPLYFALPAALPIATFLFYLYFIRYIFKLRQRKFIVHEIWMDKNGSELIFKYRNVQYRRLRSQQDTEIFNIDNIYNNPKVYGKGFSLWSEDLLPANYDKASFTKQNLFSYWKKVYSVDKRYVLLHKNPVYADFSLLCEVFKGKKVTLNEENHRFFYLDTANTNEKDVIQALQDLKKASNHNNTTTKDTHDESLIKELREHTEKNTRISWKELLSKSQKDN